MNIQNALYVSFGIASLIPFGLRFLIQWILSERKKESYVTSIFWKLSIAGNILLAAHYLIQVQYHLYFVRFFPLYIGFRQLALMQNKASPFSWKKLFKMLFSISFVLTLLFMLRTWLQYHHFTWIQSLSVPWQNLDHSVSSFWHFLGFAGATLFVSRLWVQWWQSEKSGKSFLGPAFWWISLIGGSLTLLYALYIRDYVTALGYVTGIIPYARNLVLIYKSKKREAI